jgi:hypothetical protein
VVGLLVGDSHDQVVLVDFEAVDPAEEAVVSHHL